MLYCISELAETFWFFKNCLSALFCENDMEPTARDVYTHLNVDERKTF